MADRPAKVRLDSGFAALRRRVEAAQPPADGFARLTSRIETRGRVRRIRLAGVAMASLALIVAFVWARPRPAPPGFELAQSSRELQWTTPKGGGVTIHRGEATFTVPELAVSIRVGAGTALRRESSGVRVLRGSPHFDVTPRRGPTPVRVLVSHGAIEVVGTAFTVTQESGGGSVSLEHGVIRFVSPEGRVRTLAPGETLRWPLESEDHLPAPPATPALGDESPAPEPARRAPPTKSPSRGVQPPRRAAGLGPADAQLLEELDALRIRREYGPLVTRLERELRRESHEPLRERLSFELCDVLARHSETPARACSRIAQHLRRYPRGEYLQSLTGLREELGCEHAVGE